MKILAISDVECPALWDYFRPERVAGVDLIVSCGDLKREYLEFLVTMANRPVLYVPGNHDKAYVKAPPEGCENIDGMVYQYRGVRFLGLGGCKFYNDPVYQYTEKQMEKRIRALRRPRMIVARGVKITNPILKKDVEIEQALDDLLKYTYEDLDNILAGE